MEFVLLSIIFRFLSMTIVKIDDNAFCLNKILNQCIQPEQSRTQRYIMPTLNVNYMRLFYHKMLIFGCCRPYYTPRRCRQIENSALALDVNLSPPLWCVIGMTTSKNNYLMLVFIFIVIMMLICMKCLCFVCLNPFFRSQSGI